MADTVLILGAAGRFGRHATHAFRNAGWAVRVFDRGRDDLMRAAAEADVIVNAWNPPYDRWAATLPGLTRAVIAAARQNDAAVVIPGNVYVFGAEAPEVFDGATPHGARNPLGRVRVALEAAYRDSGVRTIVLRGGDFLDTAASGNWFDRVMLARLGRGRFVYPGDPDRPHAWAFLPDMAAAAVALAGMRGELGRFEDVPFPGYTLTGRALGEAVATAVGRPLRLVPMNWLPLRLIAPVWPMGRHIVEMRYLWSKPHRLDGARLDALLPRRRVTPVRTAVSAAVWGAGGGAAGARPEGSAMVRGGLTASG